MCSSSGTLLDDDQIRLEGIKHEGIREFLRELAPPPLVPTVGRVLVRSFVRKAKFLSLEFGSRRKPHGAPRSRS